MYKQESLAHAKGKCTTAVCVYEDL